MMRLPRMTTRRWMVVVAVVGTSVGAAMLAIRSRTYAALAALHTKSELECRRVVEAFKGRGFDGEIWSDAIAYARRCRRLVPYHAALRHKYEHAARTPWLPVEPDPPEPQ